MRVCARVHVCVCVCVCVILTGLLLYTQLKILYHHGILELQLCKMILPVIHTKVVNRCLHILEIKYGQLV